MRGELDFERLVSEFYAPLYRFAFSLAREENDALDLTQQTFYIWAVKGHQLREGARVKSWLFTTLHRQFLELQRKRDRFTRSEPEETLVETPTVEPDPSTRLESRDPVHLLEEVDPIYRAPVALYYLEDYSYKEIAEILDVPLGTIKSRIARGIGQLQEAFFQSEKMQAKRANSSIQ